MILLLGHLPAWPGITQSGELSCSPSSTLAFEFIRARLEDCDNNHQSCKASSSELPTRMIDVGIGGSAGADYVRLVESSSLPRSPRVTYVALSYCWGLGQSVTTVSTNYEAMKQGIHISELPPTIRDAITVTRNMGERYLWIDALCIIQDSSTDWELESARMASVYQNAYITVAAGTAAAASEGFLELRQHLAARSTNAYQAEWEAGINSDDRSSQPQKTILAARVIPYSTFHSMFMVADGLPLNTRGWTMQEKILSRRVITYTTHELQWTCQSLSTCECGYLLDSSERGDTITVNPTLNRREASYEWAKIVKKYSSRSLTYLQDKLPAISGVAHAFQSILQSPYLGGHWVNNLPEELAWKAYPPHVHSSDTVLDDDSDTASQPQYIAPTFCWPSIRKGSVECVYLQQQSRTWRPCSTVQGFHSEVLGENPLGRINNGVWISLRGHLVKAQLTIKRFPGFYTVEQVVLPNGGKAHMFADTFLEEFDATVLSESESKNGEMTTTTTTDRSIRRSHISLPGPKSEKGLDCPVYLFLLGYWTEQAKGSSNNADGAEVQEPEPERKPEPNFAFLVLGHSPNQLGKYERIGFGMSFAQIEGASKLEDGELDKGETLKGLLGGDRRIVTIV